MTADFSAQFYLHSVSDSGVPHRERINFHAREGFDISLYGVLLGVDSLNHQSTVPVADNYFWFGNMTLDAGDWITLYTGPGTARTEVLPDGKMLYSLYWDRKRTVFYDPRLLPILIRMDYVQAWRPDPPQALPQEVPGSISVTDVLSK